MNTFKKKERLKSKKLIEQLFEQGKSIDTFPLRMIWMPIVGEIEFPVQAGFTVAKRNFPKAVERNRIKRLMRESWRLQKHEFYQFLAKKNVQLAAMLIFTGKKKPEYKDLSEGIASIMNRLKKSV